VVAPAHGGGLCGALGHSWNERWSLQHMVGDCVMPWVTADELQRCQCGALGQPAAQALEPAVAPVLMCLLIAGTGVW